MIVFGIGFACWGIMHEDWPANIILLIKCLFVYIFHGAHGLLLDGIFTICLIDRAFSVFDFLGFLRHFTKAIDFIISVLRRREYIM